MTKDPLERIAAALERMSPPPMDAPDLAAATAFVWHVEPDRLDPVEAVNRVDLDLLVGIDRAQDILVQNTRQFAAGLPANNALLWGARGMGKSSLVKAVHGAVQADHTDLKLIEIQREDLPSIARLLSYLRGADARVILFCDDLSFSHDDQHYKSLKAVLDGGVEGRPDNVDEQYVRDAVTFNVGDAYSADALTRTLARHAADGGQDGHGQLHRGGGARRQMRHHGVPDGIAHTRRQRTGRDGQG